MRGLQQQRQIKCKLIMLNNSIWDYKSGRMVYIVFLETVLTTKFKMAAQSGGQYHVENKKKKSDVIWTIHLLTFYHDFRSNKTMTWSHLDPYSKMAANSSPSKQLWLRSKSGAFY